MAPVYASGGQYVTVGQGVGGQVSGGGGGIGSWLFSLFYQRYADSHTEAITYTGPGQGNIESRLVEVGAGQGSYMAKRTPTYSYRPRYCVICCCGFFGLLLILIPLLMLCEVQRFFGLTDTCGSYNDVCENNCALLADAYNMKPYCCASCPFQVQNNGLQCEAPHSPPEIHTVVRRHYNTIYRKVPVNHYVKVQMPQQPPLVHTVKVVTPPKEYDCEGMDGHPNPVWSGAHTRWCCYKYKEYCPHTVVDKDYYHTVTKVQHIKVPVPEPMPTHAPIVHTIHHRYHVPSPPKYVKVHVPGPTVVKPVVVHDRVPVPVKEPPQVINVKKPYTVHVKGRDHYVKVPVPSPPHVVTHYHTHWNTVIDHSYDCQNGLSDWHHLWSHSKRAWCCSHHNSGCSHHNSGHWSHQMSHHNSGHWVKKVHVVQTYDCHAGFDNWYHGWSDGKKSWCCEKKTMGCPGSWHHGHWHHSHHAVVIHEEHVGHGGYDCHAGASNWMQGWSGKKKDWCCSKGHNQFCVKFHCHAEHAKVNAWSSEQRDFCCSNFQMGCPHTTLSPLGCDAMCVVNGESSSCKSRMKWTQHNVFGGKSNACNLAYSKIQVECDVCRACSIEAAGCGAQGPGKAAFDCHAALGNWCRAWSPAKKVWCCNEKQKGCQSPDTPPNCDAGAGKIWKKVFISGHWTWEAQMAGGAVSVHKPFSCHAGLPNWSAGWSPSKKSWVLFSRAARLPWLRLPRAWCWVFQTRCGHSPLRLWRRCSWRCGWRCCRWCCRWRWQLVVIVQWQLALWWTCGGSSPSSRGSLGWKTRKTHMVLPGPRAIGGAKWHQGACVPSEMLAATRASRALWEPKSA